jgi:hypothetical protein
MPNPTPFPSKSTLHFVEQALSTHKNVASFFRRGDGLYHIERNKEQRIVVVSLTDIYTLGTADVIEAMHISSDLNCVVTTSAWNSYTRDAKSYGKEHEVGVFKLPEFLGALWFDKFWTYVKRQRD